MENGSVDCITALNISRHKHGGHLGTEKGLHMGENHKKVRPYLELCKVSQWALNEMPSPRWLLGVQTF